MRKEVCKIVENVGLDSSLRKQYTCLVGVNYTQVYCTTGETNDILLRIM